MPILQEETTTGEEFEHEDLDGDDLNAKSYRRVRELSPLVAYESLDSGSSTDYNHGYYYTDSTKSSESLKRDDSRIQRTKAAVSTKSTGYSPKDCKAVRNSTKDTREDTSEVTGSTNKTAPQRKIDSNVLKKSSKSGSEKSSDKNDKTGGATQTNSRSGCDSTKRQTSTEGWSTGNSRSTDYKTLSGDMLRKKNYTFTRPQLWKIALDNKFIDSKLRHLSRRTMSPEFYNYNMRQLVPSSAVNRRKEDERIRQANKVFYTHLCDIGAGKNRRNLSFGRDIDWTKLKKTVVKDQEDADLDTDKLNKDDEYLIQDDFKF